MKVNSIKTFNQNSVPNYAPNKQQAKDVQFCGSLGTTVSSLTSGKALRAMVLAAVGFLGAGALSACGQGVDQEPNQSVGNPAIQTPTDPAISDQVNLSLLDEGINDIFDVLGFKAPVPNSPEEVASPRGTATSDTIPAGHWSGVQRSKNLTGGYVPAPGSVIRYGFYNTFFEDTEEYVLSSESTPEKRVFDGTYTDKYGHVEHFKRSVSVVEGGGLRIDDDGVPPVVQRVVDNRVVVYGIVDGSEVAIYSLNKGANPGEVIFAAPDGGGVHRLYNNFVVERQQ